MRGRALIACSFALAAACGEDTPTRPATGTPVLRANVAAASQVPPITGVEAGATGTATLTLNPRRDGDGLITGGTLDFVVTLSGLPADARITAMQVQVGGAAANGVVVQDSGLTAQGGAVLPSGSGTVTVRGVPVSGLTANALVANPAAYYLNVRSERNPNGVARGQLLFP